jgi:hypothetical protein
VCFFNFCFLVSLWAESTTLELMVPALESRSTQIRDDGSNVNTSLLSMHLCVFDYSSLLEVVLPFNHLKSDVDRDFKE